MTALLADAVYIAMTDAIQTARPNITGAPTMPTILTATLRFLKADCAKPILPYAALFEANVIGAMVNRGAFIPPIHFPLSRCSSVRCGPTIDSSRPDSICDAGVLMRDV